LGKLGAMVIALFFRLPELGFRTVRQYCDDLIERYRHKSEPSDHRNCLCRLFLEKFDLGVFIEAKDPETKFLELYRVLNHLSGDYLEEKQRKKWISKYSGSQKQKEFMEQIVRELVSDAFGPSFLTSTSSFSGEENWEESISRPQLQDLVFWWVGEWRASLTSLRFFIGRLLSLFMKNCLLSDLLTILFVFTCLVHFIISYCLFFANKGLKKFIRIFVRAVLSFFRVLVGGLLTALCSFVILSFCSGSFCQFVCSTFFVKWPVHLSSDSPFSLCHWFAGVFVIVFPSFPLLSSIGGGICHQTPRFLFCHQFAFAVFSIQSVSPGVREKIICIIYLDSFTHKLCHILEDFFPWWNCCLHLDWKKK